MHGRVASEMGLPRSLIRPNVSLAGAESTPCFMSPPPCPVTPVRRLP